jgi:hypothetical protein
MRVKPRLTKTGKPTWELDFTGPDGKRRRESFQDKEEAEDRARQLNTESTATYNIPEETRLEAFRCQKLLDGSGMTLRMTFVRHGGEVDLLASAGP